MMNECLMRAILFSLSLPFLSSCASTAVALGCLQTKSSYKPPTVTRGEFQFELQYQKDDQVIVVEDVMVCTYNKGVCGGGQWFDDWKQSLKSGPNALILAKLAPREHLKYRMGECSAFMGRNRFNLEPNTNERFVDLVTKTDAGRQETLIRPDELEGRFGIKILDWEISTSLSGARK